MVMFCLCFAEMLYGEQVVLAASIIGKSGKGKLADSRKTEFLNSEFFLMRCISNVWRALR